MNRQAAMIARLRETGGDRVSVNLPGDVMSALRAEVEASGRTMTDVIVAFLRSAIPARRVAAVIRSDVPFGPVRPILAEIRRRAEFWGPFRPYAFRSTASFPAAYIAEATIPEATPVAEAVEAAPAIKAVIRVADALWGPFRPTVRLPAADAKWPRFVEAYQASTCPIERQAIASEAVFRSMQRDRSQLFKTGCPALDRAMVETVAMRQMQIFAEQVAAQHGEAVEDELDTWLGLIDTAQVFGHLHTLEAAHAEFAKFLAL